MDRGEQDIPFHDRMISTLDRGGHDVKAAKMVGGMKKGNGGRWYVSPSGIRSRSLTHGRP